MGKRWFSIVDALPSKAGGAFGWLAMGYATIWPERAGRILDDIMTVGTVQLWGAVGLVAFTAYWILWFWLRSYSIEEPAPSVSQAVHGAGSQVFGTVQNVHFAATEAANPIRLAAAPETIKLLRTIEEKYCRNNYMGVFQLLEIDDTIRHNIVLAVGSNLGAPYIKKDVYEKSQDFFDGGGTVLKTNIENFSDGLVRNLNLPDNKIVYVNFTKKAGEVKDELSNLALSPFMPLEVSESILALAKAVGELYTKMIVLLDDCFQNQRVRLIMAANDPVVAAGLCNDFLDRAISIEQQIADLRNAIRKELSHG